MAIGVVSFLRGGADSRISFVLKNNFIRGGGDTMEAVGSESSCDSRGNHLDDDDNQDDPDLILIIDVDNTLYDEQHLRRTLGLGIEEQIVANTREFFQNEMNLTLERAQELYQKYGSAIEGLRHEYWHDYNEEEMEQWMQRYYHNVYDDIDVSGLYNKNASPNKHGGIIRQHEDASTSSTTTINTGYSHSGNSQDQLRTYLEGISSHPRVKLYLASNSPKWHVDKVVRALGLNGVAWAGIVTPDTVENHDNSNKNNRISLSHPTKHSPRQFFHKILQQHSGDTHRTRIVFLDDSLYNLQRAKQELGFGAVHIQHYNDTDDELFQHSSLLSALQEAVSTLYADDRDIPFSFQDVTYLRSKNVVDRTSMNSKVYHRLSHILAQSLLLSHSTDDEGNAILPDQLCIVDLGAGLLSMLEMFLAPSGDDQESSSSLFQTIQHITGRPLRRVIYYAYESNQALIDECRLTLAQWGFEPSLDAPSDSTQHNCQHFGFQRQQGLEVTVHLKNFDFRNEQFDHDRISPQLIVGCCFADLFQPHELVPDLFVFLSKAFKQSTSTTRCSAAPLVYFPITFAGSTQFVPPSPFDCSSPMSIPSDTTAFGYYARALQERGHNLDPSLLIKEMERFGVTLIASGPSHWNIDPACHEYLWRCMMHFFERTGFVGVLKRGWDSCGWLRRAFSKRPTIIVSNVDLLFRLPPLAASQVKETASLCSPGVEGKNFVDEIQFVAPCRVTTVTKPIAATLMPKQIRVKSVCSLISSGTELKIFQGMFSEDVLDVNIKGMSDQRMSYPLAYGYSMVGRIVECGSDIVNAKDILGRLVFSFSPHATGMILDLDSVHLVPEGISAEDAMFMPAVETAISIVHDAHVRIGENVAVFGQGLIGLLVTSILSLQKIGPDGASGKFGTVTAFDTLTDRLAASGMMGASQALFPSEASQAGPFDVSIEVSGNPRALQAAIDNTLDGGRIVVASWYGNANFALKLGMDFHRSHKTIKTSQVSELPAELTGLWNKQRRFALTWELLQQIRPSRLLTKRMTLGNAQEAYEALGNGTEIAVAFNYETR